LNTVFIAILMLVAFVVFTTACAAADAALTHWDFETGLQGWHVVSGNLGPQPTDASDDRWGGDFGKQGTWFIGTCELPDGSFDDGRTGELRSPTFIIRSGSIRLLVGGGGVQPDATYVALVRASNNQELKRSWGRNRESMLPVVWDVSEYRGVSAYIAIVDRATGGWGHINVDDIRELTPDEEAEVARQKAAAAQARAKRVADFKASLSAPSRKIVYSGPGLTDLAMPHGGIGAGSVAIGGRGDLREWQIFNACNSSCIVPGSFFAVRVDHGGEPIGRVLQMDALAPVTSAPVETGVRPTANLPPIQDIKFVGEYPIAELSYEDDALPIEVSLATFSPFVPMAEKDSGLPVIVFDFTIRNPLARPVGVAVLASCQNAVGYDGRGIITGPTDDVAQFDGYGGNVNAVVNGKGFLGVAMTAPDMDPAARQFGSMALLTTAAGATARASWTNPSVLWQDFIARGAFETEGRSTPTAKGHTANCAVVAPMTLKPGETKTVSFVLAWHFPNRYADYDANLAKYRIGNMYSNWFDNAQEAAEYAVANLPRLTAQTSLFRDTFYDSNLPYWLLDCISSQISTLRSPTVMWIEDGTFAAFEGGCCCPMNCTHVWNYEQTLAKLFPALERNMRNTDFGVQQDPSGFIHHRTVLPLSLPRASGPFVDGHLGCIMKMYREYLQSADDRWLKEKWPRVKLAMDWAMQTYDPDANGVIEGEQWNTYDCAVYGPNTFIGTWWLGALRSAERMATVCGDEESAQRYRERYDTGRAAMDRDLWNGEYYIQLYDEQKYAKTQYGTGCLADQVIGQWFAHVTGLGDILPREHVRSALRAIVDHNFVWDFNDFAYTQRVFAYGADMGLLCSSWPRGGRPAEPILYRDEVWTGVEYQVAAHLIYEGMIDEAWQIVKAARNRYDGVARPPFKRNPWDEIECGEHYARAMSSWALLLAAQGYMYDGPNGIIAFDPRWSPDRFRSFFTTAEGWGVFDQKRGKATHTVSLDLKCGTAMLREIRLRTKQALRGPRLTVTLNGGPRSAVADVDGDALTVRFARPVRLKAGDTLAIQLKS
jgi:non-lysosomal glucosylceramidase